MGIGDERQPSETSDKLPLIQIARLLITDAKYDAWEDRVSSIRV